MAITMNLGVSVAGYKN